jgi:hypothetical protein
MRSVLLAFLFLCPAGYSYSAEPISSEKYKDNERAAVLHLAVDIVSSACRKGGDTDHCNLLIRKLPTISECLRDYLEEAKVKTCEIDVVTQKLPQ